MCTGADRIVVRHRHGRVVAIVEIVSPGNKASKNELRTFVEKTSNLIAQGVHLLVIDLFSPSKRDPQGIHKAIWDEFVEEDFELPADAAIDSRQQYDAGPPPAAYVEFVAVGEALPDMPIFLKPDIYVPAPLEETYRTTWDDFFPAPMGTMDRPGSARLSCHSAWRTTINDSSGSSISQGVTAGTSLLFAYGTLVPTDPRIDCEHLGDRTDGPATASATGHSTWGPIQCVDRVWTSVAGWVNGSMSLLSSRLIWKGTTAGRTSSRACTAESRRRRETICEFGFMSMAGRCRPTHAAPGSAWRAPVVSLIS